MVGSPSEKSWKHATLHTALHFQHDDVLKTKTFTRLIRILYIGTRENIICLSPPG